MKKPISKQAALTKLLLKGKSVTVQGLRDLGWINPYSAIYHCRQAGVNVQRNLKATRAGLVSYYKVVAE